MKVAIIGAGICGLYLGWKLAEKRHSVTIFEKRPKIGKEVCSGLFSQRILEFIPESKNLIQNEISHCLINFPKRNVKIKFLQNFFVMSHYELDNLAAKSAEKFGAKIILNSQINVSELKKLMEEFEKIIGCDGPNSVVRKNVNLTEPNFRLAIQGFTTEENYSNFVETWATKNGFIWKIPRGKETEYGVIENTKSAKKIFEEFLKTKNIKIENIGASLVPQGFAVPKNEQITLCGDAAGLTKPWSGGGVIWGLTAAQILLQNFPDFLKYRAQVKKFFLPRIIFSKIATKTAYLLGFNFPWLLPSSATIESDFLR